MQPVSCTPRLRPPATGKQTRFLGSRNSSVSGTSEGTLASPAAPATYHPTPSGSSSMIRHGAVPTEPDDAPAPGGRTDDRVCGTPTGRTFRLSGVNNWLNTDHIASRGCGAVPGTVSPQRPCRNSGSAVRYLVSRRRVGTKGIDNGRKLQRVLREMQGQTRLRRGCRGNQRAPDGQGNLPGLRHQDEPDPGQSLTSLPGCGRSDADARAPAVGHTWPGTGSDPPRTLPVTVMTAGLRGDPAVAGST